MISGGLGQKVRRTERLQTGVQPPFMYSTSQSPERATDSQRHAFCHPFGVLFFYSLCAGVAPLPVLCRPRRGLFALVVIGGLRPKVRRTERPQTGVQPPFMYSTSQSPEGATDDHRHAFCHPFGVLFYLYPLRRGCTPACVMSSPSGTFCPCGYQRPEGPIHSQPRATPWGTWQHLHNAL